MTIQEMELERIKRTCFNEMDGATIAASLEANRGLWRGVIIDRIVPSEDASMSLIKLRDIEQDYWNVDTLFILVQPQQKEKMEALARTWKADAVFWIAPQTAARMLGGDADLVLQVWWD